MIPAAMYAETLRSLLGPVQPLMDDPSVSEVMINGPERIFVERRGRIELTSARFESEAAVLAALRNIAQFAGTFVDADNPILEARLPDGSRVEAVVAPIAEHGPVVAIRRFSKSTLGLADLVELGSLTRDAAEALRALTVAKRNIAVSGGTGSGKTSLLNVLLGLIPESERLLVLEDTRELDVKRAHVVYLCARKPDEHGAGEVTIRDLFRASLRMRPDRITVGEVRGAEALDMIQAMVSGHGGCLSTLHASTPLDALARLETMCMMSDVALPLPAIRSQIGSGIEIVVQAERLADGRRVISKISEVVGPDASLTGYVVRDLFVFRSTGQDERGRVLGRLEPTGVIPSCEHSLPAYGVSLPRAMYDAARAGGAA